MKYSDFWCLKQHDLADVVLQQLSPCVNLCSYRIQSLKVHPDKAGTRAEPAFQKLAKAYTILGDPVRHKFRRNRVSLSLFVRIVSHMHLVRLCSEIDPYFLVFAAVGKAISYGTRTAITGGYAERV